MRRGFEEPSNSDAGMEGDDGLEDEGLATGSGRTTAGMAKRKGKGRSEGKRMGVPDIWRKNHP
jgi:hypothetical protein